MDSKTGPFSSILESFKILDFCYLDGLTVRQVMLEACHGWTDVSLGFWISLHAKFI